MLPTDASAAADGSFEAIETALAQTARGRAFMAELSRRARGGETEILLGAIARLERRVAGVRVAEEMERLRRDLGEMNDTIHRARAEALAAARPSQGSPAQAGAPAPLAASGRLDQLLRGSERATLDVLDATEQIQETAWTMREGGFDGGLCDALDRRATDIYAACAAQDLAAKGLDRVVAALDAVGTRLGEVNEAWGVGAARTLVRELEPNRPAPLHDDIDFVLVDEDPQDRPDDRTAELAAAADDAPDIFDAYASLPIREQLRLLT